MSDFVYLLFSGGLLIVDLAVLLCLYVFGRNASYMTLSADEKGGEVPFFNTVQALFFAAAAIGVLLFSAGTGFYENKAVCAAIGLAVVFVTAGFVPEKSPKLRIVSSVIELGTLTAAVFVLPAPDVLPAWNMPLPAAKVLIAVVWFLMCKIGEFGAKRDELICGQAFFVGLVLFLAVFVTHFPLRAVLQTGGLLLPLMIAAVPFQVLYGLDIVLKKPFVNLLNLMMTGAGFALAAQGAWGCGILLLTYPLFELVFGSWRLFSNLFRRKEKRLPVFVCAMLEQNGYTSWRIVDFVFRRNLVFGAMMLLTLDRLYLQKQMVMLAVLLYVKFAMNIANPGAAKASLRSLFKQIGEDARKGWRETGDSIAALKEKYKDSDKR